MRDVTQSRISVKSCCPCSCFFAMESLSSDPVSLEATSVGSNFRSPQRCRHESAIYDAVRPMHAACKMISTETDLQCKQFTEVCTNAEHVLRQSSARAGGLAFCPTWTESWVTRSHARYRYTNWLRNGNLCQSLADSSTWPSSFFLSLTYWGSLLCLYSLQIL